MHKNELPEWLAEAKLRLATMKGYDHGVREGVALVATLLGISIEFEENSTDFYAALHAPRKAAEQIMNTVEGRRNRSVKAALQAAQCSMETDCVKKSVNRNRKKRSQKCCEET